MKKSILLSLILIVVGVAFYFYSEGIKEKSYPKEFKEEFLIYGSYMKKWNDKEDLIVKEYNEEIANQTKEKEKIVESYEKIKEVTIPKTKELIKEIEKIEAKEDDTKKLKETYIELLNKQIEIYELNYKSYAEQSKEAHEKAKEKIEEYQKERDKFNKRLSNIYKKVEINLITKED